MAFAVVYFLHRAGFETGDNSKLANMTNMYRKYFNKMNNEWGIFHAHLINRFNNIFYLIFNCVVYNIVIPVRAWQSSERTRASR